MLHWLLYTKTTLSPYRIHTHLPSFLPHRLKSSWLSLLQCLWCPLNVLPNAPGTLARRSSSVLSNHAENPSTTRNIWIVTRGINIQILHLKRLHLLMRDPWIVLSLIQGPVQLWTPAIPPRNMKTTVLTITTVLLTGRLLITLMTLVLFDTLDYTLSSENWKILTFVTI